MKVPLTIVIVIVVGSLALNLLATDFTLLIGLFDTRVNNADIFKIIGPAYQNVTGAFTGFFGGLALGKLWGEKS